MKSRNNNTGITYGIIIGLVYVLLLFWRWNSVDNLLRFGIISVVSYVIIIGLLIFEAFQRRKLEEGFIDLKNLFQTLFISVLIFELIYAIYNFIHLKYIDPEAITRMQKGLEEILDKAGNMSEADKQKSLDSVEKIKEGLEFVAILKNYLISVAVSGVVALLISLLVRKNKPVFVENQ